MDELNNPGQAGPDRRGSWWRRFVARRDGSRRRPGRPLTLALGWLLSCVVITAVTYTAVDRVGREVSGSQGLITTPGAINKQVAAQSASAASASSAARTPTADAAPPVIVQTPTFTPPTPTASKIAPVKVTPSTSPPAPPPSSPPAKSPSPSATLPRPPGIEYVFTCVDGAAVGGVVPPSTSPTPTPTPTPTATTSGSPSTSVSASPTLSVSPSPSPSASPTHAASSSVSPTASPSPGKSIETVPGGTISIACLGNTIAYARATTTDPTYTLTPRSLVDPRIDVFFSKN